MSEILRYQKFHQLLGGVFSQRECGAILTPEGQPLHIKFEDLADIGTLPRAGMISNQYLRLEPGQVALMNDPYSGGTLLSALTLITGVSLSLKPEKTDLILVYRKPLKPTLRWAPTVDEEGLRIPPTPIADRKSVNTPLLETMSQHPLISDGFLKGAMEALTDIRRIQDNLVKAFQICEIGFSRNFIQGYLAESVQRIRHLLSEVPLKDCETQYNLEDGSRLKVRMESTGQKIILDFTGTTPSDSIGITDAAAFGACIGAISTAFEGRIPLNAGIYQAIEVRTPTGTMVNARYPAPTFLGMTDGVILTANLVMKALGLIFPEKAAASCGAGPCAVDIRFEDGSHFFDSAVSGIGAFPAGRGEDAISFWNRSHLQPSIEEIEKRFPLLISAVGLRMVSGGKGTHRGGDGMTKVYLLRAPAEVRWALGPHLKLEGAAGGSPGAEPEIIFTHDDGTKEKGSSKGMIRMAAGESITLMSSGGGGWGRG